MAPGQYTTLLKLQTIIKQRLEDAMPVPCWVAAEISELKVNYSGHCYMELVEKGGANQVPKAKAQAVVWRSTYGALASYFRTATGRDLEPGMNVLLKVSVTYHELYGLSLNISDIDPMYTLGDMERQRRETIGKLQADGVYDMNSSLELPPLIQSIAVVSSRNAAGYQDFINELASSGFRFHITLFDAFMQGHATEESVISALDSIAGCCEDFDAVVLIRGGGSQSDLAAFDSYRLCSHVAQFPIPVITGIGHDKDQSVADLVAAVSLKTPTAVAAWLVAGLDGFERMLAGLKDELVASAVALLENEQRRVREASYGLSQASSDLTHRIDMKLAEQSAGITYACEKLLAGSRHELDSALVTLTRNTGILIERQKNRLATAAMILDGRRPEKILSMGFSIVRKNGRAIFSPSEISGGDVLDIMLSGGSITAKAESSRVDGNVKVANKE